MPDRQDADSRVLRADCSSCAGLCCVFPAFAASADFAVDKPAGRPCANLGAGDRCTIHGELRERGFAGCTVYDCFGAGQRLCGETFAGLDRRSDPALAAAMAATFDVLRPLHELLWHLREAIGLPAARPVRQALSSARDRIEERAALPAAELAAVDVSAERAVVNSLLQRASALARATARSDGAPGADRRGADLVGADLRGHDLVGASLRGATLVGADLRGADLRLADLTGADLRAARLAGADLSSTLFQTQSQLQAATGDAATRLRPDRDRPRHWTDPANRSATTPVEIRRPERR